MYNGVKILSYRWIVVKLSQKDHIYLVNQSYAINIAIIS